MRVAKGYKVLIENPNGDIVEVIDVGYYDLDKQMARGDIIDQVQEAIERAEAKLR